MCLFHGRIGKPYVVRGLCCCRVLAYCPSNLGPFLLRRPLEVPFKPKPVPRMFRVVILAQELMGKSFSQMEPYLHEMKARVSSHQKRELRRLAAATV